VSGTVFLNLENPETGNVQIDMITSAGAKELNVFSGTLSKGKHVLTLDPRVSMKPAGIYLLRIRTMNEVQTVKIIVR
jgi:hypothetical protein